MKVSSAKAKIDRALAKNDGSVIGEFMADERASVSSYAEEAFAKLIETGVENDTPTPPEPEDNELMPEMAEVSKVEKLVGWIDMSPEESIKHQTEKRLVGYNPKNGTGLLN